MPDYLGLIPPYDVEPEDEPNGWDEVTLFNRFELYGALWAFCSRWHGGQSSRGYRILSRLSRAGYNPGLGLQQGRFESQEQADIYRELLKYRESV